MKIEFDYPLLVGGEIVKAAEYDYGKLKGRAFIDIFRQFNLQPDPNPMSPDKMLVIGAAVIVASNPGKGWTPDDFVNNAAGSDIWKVEQVGIGFFGAKPEEQHQKSSGDATAPTQNDTTPQSLT